MRFNWRRASNSKTLRFDALLAAYTVTWSNGEWITGKKTELYGYPLAAYETTTLG
jgi:hypothetical protein